MRKDIDTLTIYDLIPFIKGEYYLVWQPPRENAEYRWRNDDELGILWADGHWAWGDERIPPKVCGNEWDFHALSGDFYPLHIAPPSCDWKESLIHVKDGKIIKE